MITTVHHIGLTVRNLDRAAAFFHNTFGFAPIAADADATLPGVANQTGRSATLGAPNCYLQLIETTTVGAEMPRARPVNEAGITHICVQSHSIDVLYTCLTDAGAQLPTPPIALGTGNLYLYARDAEANVIEVEGLSIAPHDQAPWVAHVAIATPNIERLAAFYHRLLGGTRRGGTKIGPNPLYDQVTGLHNVEVIPTWIVSTNVTLELWQYLNPPTVALPQARPLAEPGYSHICVEVGSMAQALQTCQRAGAAVVTPPVEAYSCVAALVRDPDGNLVELVELIDTDARSARNLPMIDIIQQVEALANRPEQA